MKKLLTLIITIVLIAVLLLVGVLVTKDRIIRTRAIAEVERITGFPLQIDELKLGVLSGTFELKGCRLLNPPEFQVRETLVINEMSADVRLLSLLTSTVKFKSAVVDIPTLNIETTPEGVNNLELLQQRIKEYADSRNTSSRDEDKDHKPGDKKKKDGKSLFFGELTVRLGEGRVVDYSQGEDAAEMDVSLHIDKQYREVTELSDVAIDLTATIVQKTLFGAIGKDLGGFLQDLSEGNEDAGKNLKKEAEKFEEQFKGLLKQFR